MPSSPAPPRIAAASNQGRAMVDSSSVRVLRLFYQVRLPGGTRENSITKTRKNESAKKTTGLVFFAFSFFRVFVIELGRLSRRPVGWGQAAFAAAQAEEGAADRAAARA